jgi:ribose/xylose/arabinose/galactoside ABC-type transport system permease subunit
MPLVVLATPAPESAVTVTDLIPVITTLGAAGAFFWVLNWIINGKLHSDSEVQGLKEDKRVLFEANAELRATQAETLPLLRDILKLLNEEEV